ncbi:hypothetical protein ABIB58_002827 [Brevundimonas sp. UYEF29]|uniref:hypothetical protein n=1 Tax=Brevundimonas sp. UYEF29 TaxID=3156346 RepID=UPI003393734D
MSNETPTDALRLATRFHETYERLAPSFGYETRQDTKEFDPESPNGRLMVAVCADLAAAPASPLPGGGQCSGISGELDRRIKSEMDFIKDIASNVQRDLAELEDGFSKSQRTAKTDRAVAKMRELT